MTTLLLKNIQSTIINVRYIYVSKAQTNSKIKIPLLKMLKYEN